MSNDHLSQEEYSILVNQLGLFAKLIKDLKLAEMLNTITHLETVGPMLDPTAYRSGMGNLQRIRKIAESAYKFQQDANEVYKEELEAIGLDKDLAEKLGI